METAFEFAALLMTSQRQMKLYHWQTLSHAQHKALGHAVDDIDGLIDKWVELSIGMFERLRDIASNLNEMHVREMHRTDDPQKHARKMITEVMRYREKLASKMPVFVTIIDEIASVYLKLSYLLRQN